MKERKPSDQFNKSENRYNVIKAIQKQNDIITLLLEGKDTQKDIVPYICKKYNHTKKTANFHIQEAKNIIKNRKNHEVQTLIGIHIQRYEKIYKELYDLRSFAIAMSAMKQKENLIGFHKEGFHMKVSSGQVSSVQLVSVENEYDLNKLPTEQRERLSFLIHKAKRDKKYGRTEDDKTV